MDEAGFRAFIESRRWQFAKTMAHIPHEYTVSDWKPWAREEFEEAVMFIREHGYARRFFHKTYVYFDVGEHQYWSMGAPLEQTILINRAVRQ